MSFGKPFSAIPIQLGPYYRRKRRVERLRKFFIPVIVLIVAGAVGGAGGLLSVPSVSVLETRYDATVTDCTVVDGDTIRCGDERIRLLGIDAPELPGHCNSVRVCAPGDPHASAASLAAALTGQIQITRLGYDRYGRTLAALAGSKGDLSCWQLGREHAVYKPRWDNSLRIARSCPKVVFR